VVGGGVVVWWSGLVGVGPGRLCQHNFKYSRLSILVRIMLE